MALFLIFGSLIILMASGMPVAFGFMLINVIGVFLWWGGGPGIGQLILSLRNSVRQFPLLPLPLFILMGTLMFHSGIAPRMIDALDKWLGRLPGRLGLLAVGGGALFSTLSGSSVSSVAVLGATLTPELEKRRYKKPMSLGPILGSGGLAMMIPPSGLAVLLGALGEISIGRILVAIVIPGISMAILYATYIIVRCGLQPSVAPAYDVTKIAISEKLVATARYILPLGLIIFLVLGLIFLGVATPSEAAATGVLGTFVLAALYRRLNREMLKKTFLSSISIAGMIFMIVVGSKAFSQILAFSGASRGLVEIITGLPLAPIFIFIALQLVLLILGMFVDPVSIMMITIPIFMPIVHALGFDPVWFAVAFLLNIEMATTSPPFGMALFAMKGVAPSDTTMGDLYRAALPFLGVDVIVMILLITFPTIALWLPSVMR